MPLGLTILVAIVLAVILGLASNLAGASLVDTVILVFLAEIVLGIISIDWQLRRRPPEAVEHIEHESDIINRARQMRGHAQHEVHSIWCSMDYGEELKKYFEEFRDLKVTLFRLINVRKQRGHVTDHLERFISEIRDGKYIVTSTSHEAFEFFLADKGESLLLIPDPRKYGLSEGIYSPDADFAYAIFHMYEGLASAGNQLVIPAQASDAEARDIINKWVEGC